MEVFKIPYSASYIYTGNSSNDDDYGIKKRMMEIYFLNTLERCDDRNEKVAKYYLQVILLVL